MNNPSLSLSGPIPCATSAARSLHLQIGRLILRYYGIWAVLTLLLAWLNCFWRLSSNVVSDLDEARYGVAASEMLRSHSALVATYAGRPEYWNLKPPLGYWMQEIAFRLLGPTVFAMRVPSAVCALALVGLTLSLARRWFGRRESLLAGLVLATCFGFMSYHGARSGDLDSALSLILLVAMAQTPQLAQSPGARLLWAGMLALGFLLKSFAILPFVLTTVLYLLWSGDWRRVRWQQWVPALLLFVGVVAGWMLARVHHDGSAYFVNRMFREDLFWRTTRVLDDETVRPWGYLAVLLERFAPWPLLLLAGLALTRRNGDPLSPYTRLLLLWALVPLLSFSLARTQHHWYLDPTYAAWSMLTAIAAVRLMRSGAGSLRVVTLGLVVVALMLCEVRVIRRIGWTDRQPASQTFLLSLHARLPADERLYACFPLSHSERFILEVVDGYRVSEFSSMPSSFGSADAHAVLLMRRRQLHGPGAELSGWQIVAASRDYAVMKQREEPAAALLDQRGRSRM